MQLAILAFVFGVLLFLMSAAALALEPVSESPNIWRLALLLLASLHALAGFVAIGGVPAYAEARWGSVAVAAAAAVGATAVATIVAFRLAAQVRLGLSQGAATSIVFATLAAGCISAALVMMLTRRNSQNSL
jgi:hypothetical protein